MKATITRSFARHPKTPESSSRGPAVVKIKYMRLGRVYVEYTALSFSYE